MPHDWIAPDQTEINLACRALTLNDLDTMLHILDTHGTVTVTNCAGANVIILGALLQSIAVNAMRGDIVCPICHVNRGEFHRQDCGLSIW